MLNQPPEESRKRFYVNRIFAGLWHQTRVLRIIFDVPNLVCRHCKRGMQFSRSQVVQTKPSAETAHSERQSESGTSNRRQARHAAAGFNISTARKTILLFDPIATQSSVIDYDAVYY
jgi:hypothetical protein